METNDLTKGSVSGHLIRLTTPLIAGNILQQLYNTIDAFVIGRYGGQGEFAAMGVAGAVMNLFLFAIAGSCIGVSVILAQLYGAGDLSRFKREHFLVVVLGLGTSAAAGILGFLGASGLLSLLQTPGEIQGFARQYLKIVLLGLPASFVYNFYNALFRAVGKVRVSLGILALAVGVNLALDVFFVARLGWGIRGVAWATLTAQAGSAIFSLAYLKCFFPWLLFGRGDCRIDRSLLKTTIHYGAATGLQQTGLYLGKLLVQGAVNTRGTDMIAAYTATTRIEAFANSFGDSGSAAAAVVGAQNYGAGDRKRVRRTFFDSLWLLALLGVVSSAVLYGTAGPVTGFLLGNAGLQANEAAGQYIRIIALFYLLCFTGNAFAGYFDSCGRVEISLAGTISQISIRTLLSWLLVSRYDLNAVALATGAGWIFVNLFWTLCYRRLNLSREAA